MFRLVNRWNDITKAAFVFIIFMKVIVSSCGWTPMHYYFNGDTAAARKNGGKLWPKA